MHTQLLGRLLLGVIIMMTVGGCSSGFESKVERNESQVSSQGPVLSLWIGGIELANRSDRYLGSTYTKGMSLRELLKGSGVVEFSEDGGQILTVNNVSLDPELYWELQVDGKTFSASDWDSLVNGKAHISISAKQVDSGKGTFEFVVLVVNGGSQQSALTHSYIIPFTENLSARALLRKSGIIQLTEDNKKILAIKDYTPLTSEMWKLKVNGKQLMDNGLDLRLHPRDELEISLALR